MGEILTFSYIHHQWLLFVVIVIVVAFLDRTRRAYNAFEELKKGNLERECVEEVCNLEESREYFENDPETMTSTHLHHFSGRGAVLLMLMILLPVSWYSFC
uniref:Gla domain-containing protein n=1 Tax=Eptatretus burgeri TaxID=7764 RepID=A0A8C4WXD1_EPTBU